MSCLSGRMGGNMFEQDYIMRLIHEMVRAVLKMIFGIQEKQEILAEDQEKGKELGWYEELLMMAREGQINEAENQLSDHLDGGNLTDLKYGLEFYDFINTFSDDFLEANDYSRQEIRDGIRTILKQYGYEGLGEAFLEHM